MKVIKAHFAGACYGVQRALDMTKAAREESASVETLGPLIHNPKVVQELEEAGIKVALSLEKAQADTLIIRSHGVAPHVVRSAQARGFDLVDATCPHVKRAQRASEELAQDGRMVLVVGEVGHPEVEGLRAYAEEAGAKVLVLTRPEELPADLPHRVGVVVQTTQSRECLDTIVAELERRECDLVVKNTICTATRQRQESAAALAQELDAFVIIGGRNSSNTTRLFEICSSLCEKSYHIESSDELDEIDFTGVEAVGVTAGASTPEDQIEAVIKRLESRHS